MHHLIKIKKWIIVTFILLVSVVIYYHFIMVQPTTSNIESGIPENALLENSKKELPINEEDHVEIIVDIKGAIANPGVYEVQADTRIHKLIEMAGGFNKDADKASVNLAARLEDEMVVYIPKIGEMERAFIVSETGNNQDGKVNINSASSEELQTLTGIGPSKAESIIAYRTDAGSFTSVEELLNVPGIGDKLFEKIIENVTIK